MEILVSGIIVEIFSQQRPKLAEALADALMKGKTIRSAVADAKANAAMLVEELKKLEKIMGAESQKFSHLSLLNDINSDNAVKYMSLRVEIFSMLENFFRTYGRYSGVIDVARDLYKEKGETEKSLMYYRKLKEMEDEQKGSAR